jgi:hypothetical protein
MEATPVSESRPKLNFKIACRIGQLHRGTSIYSFTRMIIGTHFLLYSKDAEADRAFLRDALDLPCIDAGHGWLIFGMSPAELAIHPAGGDVMEEQGHKPGATLYLMCDDLDTTMAALNAKNVPCTAVENARWGSVTSLRLPSGASIGLYQPRHTTALELSLKSK